MSTAYELTMLILFLSVTFRVTCCVFNYKIMPATSANTFLFILQGSALVDLGVVCSDRF